MKTKIVGLLKRFVLSYPAVFLLLAVIGVTRPYYYADSYEYAHTIMAQEAGKTPSLFLDAGHILWRPLALVFHEVFSPVLRVFFPQGEYAQVSAVLILLVIVFSVLGVIYFYRLLRLFPISERAIHAVMILYVLSPCILNYSQTGTSYGAGLSMLIIGMFYVLQEANARTWSCLVGAGMILGTSAFLWMPYILALPAAVFSRPMVYGWNKRRFVESLDVIIGCAIIAIIILLPVIMYLHMFSIHGVLTWMLRSSLNHQASGAIRTFFGLTKLLFFVGNDALFVKRFLFHDPYHPVSLAQVVAKLWEVELFYAVIVATLVTIATRPAFRRFLPLIAIGVLPNIILSVRWDGAALERHLPLLIFFFIALALWFEASSKKGRVFFVVLLAITGILNVSSLWYAANNHREAKLDRQIEEIWPRLNPASIVSVLSSQDELAEFQGIHPFDRFNQSSELRLYAVVQLGFITARYWKQNFIDTAKQCWHAGGNVWVVKDLLKAAPVESTYWVEHSDPGVSWNDVSQYFRGLHYADSTNDFYLLQPF